MIKVENMDVWGFEHAIRGCRNPLESWGKSDTIFTENGNVSVMGKNDLDLMRRLYKASMNGDNHAHRKYLRQIFVSMDITCNQTWWAEMDTYKVGVTRNSCSKMHKIHAKEFSAEDFSHECIDEVGGIAEKHFQNTIEVLEYLRNEFNETKEKKYWRALIDLLPMGYNLKATVTMNYENVVTIIRQRSGHKLDEWNEFIEILKELPYVKEIMEDSQDG